MLIAGAGVRGAESALASLAAMLGIPLLVTWAARDMFPESLDFGTHGKRAGNLAIQSCDWLLAIGTRLDTKATGSPASAFAPKAMRFMADIDQAEIDKFSQLGLPITGYCVSADAFIEQLLAQARAVQEHDGGFPDFRAWREQVWKWRLAHPVPDTPAYDAIRRIGRESRPDDIICCDTGLALAWMMRAFPFRGQRFLHAFNQTPMGYALPAAVGAHYATGRRVLVVTGDGSIMMNLGELATIAERRLPVKIYLFDNKGHGMVRQSQRQWLQGRYVATERPALSFPDFRKVVDAFGVDMTIFEIPPDSELEDQVKFGEALA